MAASIHKAFVEQSHVHSWTFLRHRCAAVNVRGTQILKYILATPLTEKVCKPMSWVFAFILSLLCSALSQDKELFKDALE